MKKYFYYGIALWLFIVFLSLSLNIKSDNERMENILKQSANAFFQQVVITREWNSMLGGVYVPISDKARPNPYLKDKDRDITTTTGIKLTKINPAYMTRQISEIAKKELDIKFHITSLKPIRPGNAPEDWEKTALDRLEKGSLYYHEIKENGSGPEYRYMAPLFVLPSCLKCHSEQGYKAGDIRGGISVIIPFENKKNWPIYITHAIAALLVSVLIAAFGFKTEKNANELLSSKNRAEHAELEQRELLRVLCHDLTNPFGAIKTTLEISNDDPDFFNSIKDDLYLSASSGLELIELVKNMRELADNKLATRNENLLDVMNNSLVMLKHRINKKGITVNMKVDNAHYVNVERTSFLNSVINNLITNAIKFSREGSSIDITSQKKGSEVVLEIKDHGIGIPKDVLANIFDVQKSKSRKGTSGETGTGYGMPMIKKFISIYGGRIEVDTAEKKVDSDQSGTTIRLFLKSGNNDKPDITTRT